MWNWRKSVLKWLRRSTTKRSEIFLFNHFIFSFMYSRINDFFGFILEQLNLISKQVIYSAFLEGISVLFQVLWRYWFYFEIRDVRIITPWPRSIFFYIIRDPWNPIIVKIRGVFQHFWNHIMLHILPCLIVARRNWIVVIGQVEISLEFWDIKFFVFSYLLRIQEI